MMSTRKAAAALLSSMAVLAFGSGWVEAQTTTPAAPPAATAAPKPASLGLAVYPGSGQDAAKQGQDESECYTWARQQTGIDPTAAPAPAPAAEAPKGGAVKGAARGAAKGAAVGAVGDDDRVA